MGLIMEYANLNSKTLVYVGIDVSKETLDVCILPEKQFYHYKNNEKDHQKIVAELQKREVQLVLLESTGG